MKVLLVILIALRIASIIKAGVEEHPNELPKLIGSLVAGGLWIASLVWLIKL